MQKAGLSCRINCVTRISDDLHYVMPSSQIDLTQQLSRQLKFIETSCRAYDQGAVEEALRIAVSLRVLFHDTKSSTSLLTHMGKIRAIQLASTAKSINPSQLIGIDIAFFMPMTFTTNGIRHSVEEGAVLKKMTCDAWWNEPVFFQGVLLSRRDVVLSSANQDGGAHVDVSPNQKTISLKEPWGTMTKSRGGVITTEDITNHHFPLLRQFGYEVLNSADLTSLA